MRRDSVRIGMITPSSNTCLEPMTYRILGGRDDVTVNSTRIPVTRIALDAESNHQFDMRTMCQAAELLATAQVDVIVWNGTAGSWLGPNHDREIVEEIKNVTGISATTSTLAFVDAFVRFGLTRIGLITPYTTHVNNRIVVVYRTLGVEVINSVALGLSNNHSYAAVGPEDLLPASRQLAAGRPDAIVYLCTNLHGALLAQKIEEETGVPVLDSVAVTLWECLGVTGAPLLDQRWGRLLT